ncbi:threonine/serine ThrE exporter family protein [Kocuria sp.]|uniref:threonine/serine ThrE exporter family protein n=1 Tax=Kocuria sp. TaxID=1871328 RepID=UPI0026DF95F5|nr:threonine/serine exporter family protein [Kocuria sp.]MDO5619538.1 threonine/serine exporter family protein [Kocuria sp.]
MSPSTEPITAAAPQQPDRVGPEDLPGLALSLDGARRYPVSGWSQAPEVADTGVGVFGPETHLNLDQSLAGGVFAQAVATESQAERARAREEGARTEVLTAAVAPIPVLTPEEIETDRRRRQSPALTQPVTVSSRRRATTESAAVARPDTTMLAAAPSVAGPSTTVLPAAYPSSESTATTTQPRSKRVLRSLMKRDTGMTAPMALVDRLAASPFAHLRRHTDAGEKEARRTLNFALRLAETLFHYGADALEVENAIVAVCATYGVENLEVDITNQAVMINYVPDTAATASMTREDVFKDNNMTSHTVMRVVRSWTDNYAGLADTHRLVTKIIEGEMSRAEASARLEAINSRPKTFPNWIVTVAMMAAAFTITLGIGGGVVGAGISALSGLIVSRIGIWMGKRRYPEFFTMILSGFVLTGLAMMFAHTDLDISPPRVIAAGLIMLMPTTRFMSTMHDAISGFPVTAAGRIVSTGMAFAGIVAGIYAGIVTAGLFGLTALDPAQSHFEPPGVVINLVFMTVAAVFIAITLQASVSFLLPVLLSALGGLLLYHAAGYIGLDVRLQAVFGAVTVGCIAAFAAGRLRIPSLVIAVPAMTFLLPGLSIFRGMYAMFIQGQTTGDGVVSLVTAMTTIVTMAAGLVLGQYLMRPFNQQSHDLGVDRNRRR